MIAQFTMWSHDIVSQSIGLAADLKIGQYLKIPPQAMFLTQLWGTVLGMHNECTALKQHLTVGLLVQAQWLIMVGSHQVRSIGITPLLHACES